MQFASSGDMSADNRKGTCFFAPCNGKGTLTTFKACAVNKIITASKEKGDGMYNALSADIQAHKSCYCSYTSKSRYFKAAKRKSETETDDRCSKRQLKSGTKDFVFKRDCLLCGELCASKDKKNPQRWVQVRQCRTVDWGDGVKHLGNS